MGKTFVGFGFGPIQSGLFLYEAWQSGNFDRYVVAEVNCELVRALGDNGGAYELNVAGQDHIETHTIEGVELYDPNDQAGRRAIVDAIAQADEIATSLPSVKFYDIGGQASVAGILAEGLQARDHARPVVVYASENNNHAAEILAEILAGKTSPQALEKVQILNTVIGKMSGIISDQATISQMKLRRITPKISHAILVEEFNRILISRIDLAGFTRGITCFAEKADLLPFEEAKLYGHNAIHAMLAYLAELRGYETVAQARDDAELLAIARRAFVDESGAALCKRYATLDEPLFTLAGYGEYADDLIERMVNPNLHDLVERVGRDHLRKLGCDDRLFGTMQLALRYDIEPVNLARGAAAGVVSMIRRAKELAELPAHLPASPEQLTRQGLADLLGEIWATQPEPAVAKKLVDLTWAELESM